MLRALIPTDAPGNRAVFHRLPTVAGLKVDEASAGIPFLDELRRRADFHAFRHTFTTLLAQAGAPPQIAKELTRHSDLRMNGHYTDANKLPLANVILALPSAVPQNHSPTRTQESGAKGRFVTIGVTSGPPKWKGGKGEGNLAFVGKTPENGPALKAVLPSGPLVAGLGFEPTGKRCNHSDLQGETHKCAHTGPASVEDAELRRVIAAWADLPEPFRRAVLALVDSSVGGAR